MHEELKWFLLLFLGLWVAWIVTGGPDRVQLNRANPFIDEATPTKSSQIYGVKDLKNGVRP